MKMTRKEKKNKKNLKTDLQLQYTSLKAFEKNTPKNSSFI